MRQDNNVVQQIDQFHSALARIELGGKIGFILSRQNELNLMAKSLAYNGVFRGFYTQDEAAAVHQLKEIQSELDRYKAEVNQQVYNEISKELLMAILDS